MGVLEQIGDQQTDAKNFRASASGWFADVRHCMSTGRNGRECDGEPTTPDRLVVGHCSQLQPLDDGHSAMSASK